MKTKDDKIDKLIADSIKNIGLDEPTPDFTLKVMQMITAEEPVVTAEARKNYWWLLGLIPVFIGLAWTAMYFFKLTGQVSGFWTKLVSGAQPFFNSILSLTDQLKNIKISPILIISFVAILLLLAIDELLSRAKRVTDR